MSRVHELKEAFTGESEHKYCFRSVESLRAWDLTEHSVEISLPAWLNGSWIFSVCHSKRAWAPQTVVCPSRVILASLMQSYLSTWGAVVALGLGNTLELLLKKSHRKLSLLLSCYSAITVIILLFSVQFIEQQELNFFPLQLAGNDPWFYSVTTLWQQTKSWCAGLTREVLHILFSTHEDVIELFYYLFPSDFLFMQC